MIPLNGLINIRFGFGHNCNFVFLAFFFNCTFSLSLCGDIKDKVDSLLLQSLWMAGNSTCWCILTILKSDKVLVIVCWFSSFWRHFDFVKQAKFAISGHFLENTREELLQNWHVDVFWPPSEYMRFWSWYVDIPHFGVILTQWNGSNLGFPGFSLECVEGMA